MGKLVQVDTFTISSPVASIIIGGGSSGSSGLNASIDTDDVYMLAIVGTQPSVNNDQLRFRYTESGTPNTTANYDYAYKAMRTTTTFSNLSAVNLDHGRISWLNVNDVAGYEGFGLVGLHYIYNANNSSEYTFMTVEQCNGYFNPELLGFQGGNVFTVTSAVNGIQLYFPGSNIIKGTFTLYKVL